VHADTLERGRALMADSSVDAVVGSYDDTPHATTLVSRFKNLAHHYFHQRSGGPITSFWGACGLVRRDRFLEVGGFDERRFTHPSIEDVELGWRMSDRGARILLDPSVQVTHLKRWTLGSLIETDVVHRAIPWVRTSLERRRLTGELNTSVMQRIAAPLAVLFFICGLAAIPIPGARVPFLAVALLAVLINWPLFRLFWRKGGAGLLAAGFVLQQMYYVWALTGLVAGLVLYWRPGRRPVAAPPARVGC
jgi:cellulose synthase/poly-beta-1,6-N-acetylglucosamine synthase-like glycosyltransferase